MSTPELLGVGRVERVFGVDEGRQAAGFLRFGDDLQRQGGLARRLGPEDLDDAPARDAADAERVVDAERAGRDHVHRADGLVLAEPHDGAFAELLFDLADGHVECFDAFLSFVYWHEMGSFQDRIDPRNAPSESQG